MTHTLHRTAGPARCAAPVIALLLAMGTATRAGAKVFLTQAEALRLAFPPPARVERKTAFLSVRQLERARALAGSDVEVKSALVVYYIGRLAERELGTAYFDTHLVRTLPETLMVVVDPAGKIERIEVLAFSEPEEYLPRPLWVDQFKRRGLEPDLLLKGAIHGLTGATLTARAVTLAARRVLALHPVVHGGPAEGAKP
jgi:hypothetical protein